MARKDPHPTNNRLIEAFARSGISIYELAKRTELHYSTLWDWVNAGRVVSLRYADLIAEALGVKIVLIDTKKMVADAKRKAKIKRKEEKEAKKEANLDTNV